jgi:tetratricopeptide (TPR) repeat protein
MLKAAQQADKSKSQHESAPMVWAPSTFKLEWLGVLFAVGLVILLYANSLNGDFVFDDQHNIKDNPYIRVAHLDPAAILDAGLDSPHPNRPIAYISFALNYYFHKYNTFGYRLINVLIHIVTGIFIYHLIKMTLCLPVLEGRYRHTQKIALFVALIWLVHPLATQSVAYVVQRMNSMAAMFYVMSLLLYIKGRLAVSRRGKRWALFALSAISGLMALGCKENAVSLPAFIVLYEWYFLQDLNKTWLKGRLFLLLSVLGVLLLIAFVFLGTTPLNSILGGYVTRDFTLAERVLTQFRVVVHYITLIVFPHPSRLSLDYEFPLSHALLDPITTLLSLGTLAGILLIAWVKAPTERLLSFCLLWYLGNLVIESSVIPLEIIFEHRTYLPSLGIILPAVLLIFQYSHQRWLPVAILGLVVVFFATWTYQRSWVWGHPVRLYRDVVEKYPGSARGHANLGMYLHKTGKKEGVIFHLSEAIRIEPSAIAYSNLGGVLVDQQQYQEATVQLSEALRLDPDISQTHYNLGVALAGLGKRDEAISHYRQAVRINRGHASAHDNLGVILAEKGRYKEALQAFSDAVKANPQHANAQAHLGIALLQGDRAKEAVIHLREALRLQPNHPDAIRYYEHSLKRAGEQRTME